MYGEILKRFREKRKLTQSELADKVYLSGPMNISNYEMNKRLPTIDILRLLSKELQFKIEIDNGEVLFLDKLTSNKEINNMSKNVDKITRFKKSLAQSMQTYNISNIGDMLEFVLGYCERQGDLTTTWRGFMPNKVINDEDFSIDSLRKYIINNLDIFYNWEFDVELDQNNYFVLCVNFNLLDKADLIDRINIAFKEVVSYPDVDYATEIVFKHILYSQTEYSVMDYKISDIKIS